MNLSVRWPEYLKAQGYEAVHWSSIGPATASDHAIIEEARAQGGVVLTNDLDFGISLIAGGARSPSVIQLRADDLRPETLGALVVRSIETHRLALERGAIITVDSARSRLRLLDLGSEEQQ